MTVLEFTVLKIFNVFVMVPNTWGDNLIPGTALWKQNLLTCALTAAVAFEIPSL